MSFDLQAAVREGANRAGQDPTAIWPSELGSMRLEKAAGQPYVVGVQGLKLPLFAVLAVAEGEDLEVRILFPAGGVPDFEEGEPLSGVSEVQLRQAIVAAVAVIVDRERKNQAIKAWLSANVPMLPEGFPRSRLEPVISNIGVLLALRSLPGDSVLLVSAFGFDDETLVTIGPTGRTVEEVFPRIEGFTDVQVYQGIDLLKDWVFKARNGIRDILYGGNK